MTSTAQARRHRYARSTTTSVTQLLSESCSSLLQRITTRVRGNSTNPDNIIPASTSATSTAAVIGLGSTRSRLEDKYSSVLDKYGRRRGEASRREKTESRGADQHLEKDSSKSPVPLSKSATTANIVLAEKAYPYVTINKAVPVREKTPYRHGEHRLLHHQQQMYGGHNHRQKSGQMDRNERSRHAPIRPSRVGKSEQMERTLVTSGLHFCPVEIDPLSIEEPPKHQPLEDTINEREARRKEIQNLIMKYTALDEAYNKRVAEKKAEEESSRKSTAQEGKYYLLDDAYDRAFEAKSSKQKLVKASNISSKYHQKYTSALVATVSNVWP